MALPHHSGARWFRYITSGALLTGEWIAVVYYAQTVTPLWTYLGTGALLIGAFTLHALLRRPSFQRLVREPTWTPKGGLGPGAWLMVGGMILPLWLPRIFQKRASSVPSFVYVLPDRLGYRVSRNPNAVTFRIYHQGPDAIHNIDLRFEESGRPAQPILQLRFDEIIPGDGHLFWGPEHAWEWIPRDMMRQDYHVTIISRQGIFHESLRLRQRGDGVWGQDWSFAITVDKMMMSDDGMMTEALLDCKDPEFADSSTDSAPTIRTRMARLLRWIRGEAATRDCFPKFADVP